MYFENSKISRVLKRSGRQQIMVQLQSGVFLYAS